MTTRRIVTHNSNNVNPGISKLPHSFVQVSDLPGWFLRRKETHFKIVLSVTVCHAVPRRRCLEDGGRWERKQEVSPPLTQKHTCSKTKQNTDFIWFIQSWMCARQLVPRWGNKALSLLSLLTAYVTSCSREINFMTLKGSVHPTPTQNTFSHLSPVLRVQILWLCLHLLHLWHFCCPPYTL